MQLRVSSESTTDAFDLTAALRHEVGMGVPHGVVLNAFAEAVVGNDARRLEAVRQEALALLGNDALVDAAAVMASFNAVDRVADATGIPLEDDKAAQTVALRNELGIDQFPSTMAL